MTKAFLHGRTEAIRTVQPESVEFTKVGTFVFAVCSGVSFVATCLQTFFSEASNEQKIVTLRRACERHVTLTKECSQGLGQDRSVYKDDTGIGGLIFKLDISTRYIAFTNASSVGTSIPSQMILSQAPRRLLRQRRCHPSLRTLVGTCLAPPFYRRPTVETRHSAFSDLALLLRMDTVLVISSRRME